MKKTLLILSLILMLCLSLFSCDDEETTDESSGVSDDASPDSEDNVSPDIPNDSTDDNEDITGNTHIHVPADAVIENEIKATCQSDGSYNSVVYCAECGEMLSETAVLIPKSSHNIDVSNTCTLCGFCITDYTAIGDFTYFESGEVITITGYIGTSPDMYIPAYIDGYAVRHIGDHAFKENSVIVNAYIPFTVKEIGYMSFYNCPSLSSVDLGAVETIRLSAFSKTAVTEITIPACTKTIDGVSYEDGVFQGCTSLSTVTFLDGDSEGDLHISDRMFEDCSALVDLHISNQVSSIDEYAFTSCTSLTSLNLPNTVKYIGPYSFDKCTALEEINLGSVEQIDVSAFTGCAVRELVIPASVEYIHGASYLDGVFENCKYLCKVTFLDGEGDANLIIGERAFKNCTYLKELHISDQISEIESDAFRKCSSLQSLKLSDTVKRIAGYAFYDCTSLREIDLARVEIIDVCAFTNSAITSLTIPASVEYLHGASYLDGVFEDCKSLSKVTFADGDGEANLTIGERTFKNCTSLEELYISNQIKEIGSDAFKSCTSLTDLELSDTVKRIGGYAFYDCTSLQTIELASVEEIDVCAFTNSAIISLTVPASVKNIYGASYLDGAFGNCTSLKQVTFLDASGEINVGDKTFDSCSALTDVYIGSSVMRVDYHAFYGCSALRYVVISNRADESLRSFGMDVFEDCPELERLYYMGGSESWQQISIDASNGYPLASTPYYYRENAPMVSGDFWYYDKNGTPKIWNLTIETYTPEIYANDFADIFCDSPSYATEFYNGLDDDFALNTYLFLWESVHVASDPSYAFNGSDSLISKKDLYKLTLHDLLMGEVKNESSSKFFDGMFSMLEQEDVGIILKVGNAFLGDGKDPVGMGDIIASLKTKSAKEIAGTVKSAYSIDGLDYFNAIVDTASNAYEALTISSKYEAMKKVKAQYMNILTQIAEDDSNPSDLRDAAGELRKYYQDAFDMTLAQFQMKTLVGSTLKDAGKLFANKTIDVMVNSCTLFRLINFAGSGIRAILAPLDMDEFTTSYYMLKTAVYVEASLVSILNNPGIDYFKQGESYNASNYMAAVELYQNSICLGLKYSKNLLTAYINSTITSDSELEAYNNLISTLTRKEQDARDLYAQFESVVGRQFENYYS